MNSQKRVMLLIDADNVSLDVIEQAVEWVHKHYGGPHVRRAYIPPAHHFASSSTDPGLPPMGMRVRLKASFDTSVFPPQVRVVLVPQKR